MMFNFKENVKKKKQKKCHSNEGLGSLSLNSVIRKFVNMYLTFTQKKSSPNISQPD